MDSEIGYTVEESTVEESKAYMPEQVPYIVFESVQARHERHLKRLMLIIALLIILLFGSNIAWLCFYSGFDFESYDYQQDGTGINIIGDENEEVTYNGAASEDTEDDEKDGCTGQSYPSEN